jgi:hypothetical protein
MTDKVGGISAVKTKLLALIVTADSGLSPQASHVFPNWRTDIDFLEEDFPVVTVRLGTVSFPESVYGRKISPSEKGHYAVYPFSAHVWEDKAETDPKSKPACDLADKIIDVFEKYKGETTGSGIRYFYNVTARESESERGPQQLCRVIIEGFILVGRKLS